MPEEHFHPLEHPPEPEHKTRAKNALTTIILDLEVADLLRIYQLELDGHYTELLPPREAVLSELGYSQSPEEAMMIYQLLSAPSQSPLVVFIDISGINRTNQIAVPALAHRIDEIMGQHGGIQRPRLPHVQTDELFYGKKFSRRHYTTFYDFLPKE
jgi:hypothetical protein